MFVLLLDRFHYCVLAATNQTFIISRMTCLLYYLRIDSVVLLISCDTQAGLSLLSLSGIDMCYLYIHKRMQVFILVGTLAAEFSGIVDFQSS